MIQIPFLIKKTCADIEKQSYINRVNALACIMSANHGWIGATFSCSDIVSFLYHEHMDLGKKKVKSFQQERFLQRLF
ncbi:MAG: hypothetical protein ABIA04_01325 [Pseudomonadota bacterium]